MGQGEWWKIGFIITVLHVIVWMGVGLPVMKVIGML
jgi:DASS family divalent anion:Na+ symporter